MFRSRRSRYSPQPGAQATDSSPCGAWARRATGRIGREAAVDGAGEPRREAALASDRRAPPLELRVVHRLVPERRWPQAASHSTTPTPHTSPVPTWPPRACSGAM